METSIERILREMDEYCDREETICANCPYQNLCFELIQLIDQNDSNN